jgi:heme/copper-type cytochrome/quinol oxidase subunit 2
VNRDHPSPDFGTWMALSALLLVGAGLLGIMFVVLPDVVWIIFVVLGFAIFIFLHYITWGYWMLRAHQRAEQQDADDSAEQ